VLVTDGRNNSGEIDPMTAAKPPRRWGLKLTIGVGKRGQSVIPIQQPLFGRQLVPNRGRPGRAQLEESPRKRAARYYARPAPGI